METPIKKRCSKCQNEYLLEEFVRYKSKPDGRGSLCKACNRIRLKEYRAANPDAARASWEKYHANNKDKKREWRKRRQQELTEHHRIHGPSVTEQRCPRCGITKPADQFYRSNETASGLANRCAECCSAIQKEWRQTNIEKAAGKDALAWQRYRVRYQSNFKRWMENNRPKRNAYRNVVHAQRMQDDPVYRISMALRKRVYLGLKGIRKSASTEKLIACTFEDCRKYIEAQWEPWMSWDNFGEGEGTWQMDHIVPVASFDLTDPEQQRLCFHYSNLRPLCSKQNREKWHRHNPSDLEALRKRVNEGVK